MFTIKQENVRLERSINLYSALALVIGTVIGSGIFFKQASVLSYSHSTTLALLAWFLGGILTLTSGLTIAEIGSQMPETGGLYTYMHNLYGKLWGFLSGWMQITVYGPAVIAALGAYLAILLQAFFGFSATYTPYVGVLSVVLISAFNFLSNRFGSALQIITTICKLVPIFAIIIFGLMFGDQNAVGQVLAEQSTTVAGNFGVAILATLFAYDGWILIANMGGEIKNPQRILPLAIVLGLSIVLLIYVFVSYSVFKTMPADMIARYGENATPHFAEMAFGKLGGKILNIGIIISILGCMNGKVMTMPRIMYAMAKNNELPFSKQLAYLNPTMHTPMVSITVIATIASGMILTVDPDRLTEICIFTVYCFYVMTFFGVFKLRRQDSQAKRPFSVPLYPLTPIVAILGAAFVLVSELFSDLSGVLISLMIVLCGIPIFYYKEKQKK
ncbi:amino acid permease-associated protein [Ligilactobacillus apodemi DSM 16634 = JCM 16172]|uniref:Amino acid permease-associated protein n=1 Tax=Ligilactobacillus apodemi DSM 16634 = JCM 16172 TaxID=1423724 RepID=A0A0R1U180_9LACO|nr:amino acid permease-associated protein [Ligilactobacillus apodemi DSM 16634 = JCM 16172]